MKYWFIFIFNLFFAVSFAQNCKEQPVNDSVYKPSEKKKVLAEIHTIHLSNKGKIFLVNHNGKYFLKLCLNEKMGMVDLGNLEIKSGNRSYFIKNAVYHNINENDAYFFVDMGINYVATLKDEGITSVIYNTKFETKLPKEDMNAVRKTAKCFYEMHKK